MFTLKKRFRFEAAHMLPQHDGKCARLHGHSWGLEVEVCASGLKAEGPEAGMVADFGRVAAPVRALIERSLDHHYLNVTTGLSNPTSEELARWVFLKLASKVEGLRAVTVDETCTSSCRYEPDDPRREKP